MRARWPMVAVAVGALAASACGGGGGADSGNGGGGGGSSLGEAAARTIAVPSMAFRLELAVTAFGQTQDSSITGRADFETAVGEVTASSPEEVVHAVVDTEGFWVTSDATEFVTSLPDGATWVRGRFDEVGDSEVIAPLAPPALLYLVAGADDERAGAGDGSYSFDIDLARAVDEAPADRREEVEQLLFASDDASLVAHGSAVVGDDGRIHSMVAEATVTDAPGEAPPVHLRWRATFEGFGQDVTLEPPADDDVVLLADVPAILTEFFGVEA